MAAPGIQLPEIIGSAHGYGHLVFVDAIDPGYLPSSGPIGGTDIVIGKSAFDLRDFSAPHQGELFSSCMSSILSYMYHSLRIG